MGGFLLVVRERTSKFLASSGLLLMPCPIRENPPIMCKFESKLKNLISDDSLLDIEISHTKESHGCPSICCITISNFSCKEEYFSKNNSVYFLAICTNFPFKLRSWIRSCRCWYFRDRVLLSGNPLTYLIAKLQLKHLTFIS